uniref:MoCF_biosynth domain-containing protein n=1 Tax=Onchocerca volvulus TaxID=6282 RepID=A0A8R1TX90_ONCVO
MTISSIAVSDSSSKGKREDISGPILRQLIFDSKIISDSDVENFLIPDEKQEIMDMLINLCKTFDVIISTGGTGFASRDVTPEATQNVIEKRCGGLETALHMHSLQFTPFAALSRLCAGIRGSTLIVNLPGNPKAVKECFEVLEKILPHAVQLLNIGDVHDIANHHLITH